MANGECKIYLSKSSKIIQEAWAAKERVAVEEDAEEEEKEDQDKKAADNEARVVVEEIENVEFLQE